MVRMVRIAVLLTILLPADVEARSCTWVTREPVNARRLIRVCAPPSHATRYLRPEHERGSALAEPAAPEAFPKAGSPVR
jgi:hypothetical protein